MLLNATSHEGLDGSERRSGAECERVVCGAEGDYYLVRSGPVSGLRRLWTVRGWGRAGLAVRPVVCARGTLIFVCKHNTQALSTSSSIRVHCKPNHYNLYVHRPGPRPSSINQNHSRDRLAEVASRNMTRRRLTVRSGFTRYRSPCTRQQPALRDIYKGMRQDPGDEIYT